MGADVERIKERVSIVDLVAAAGLTVTGSGRIRSTAEHDSLKLWTETNTWRWFSRSEGGDQFDWWRLQNPGSSFRDALGALAVLAGVTLEPLSPEQEEALQVKQAQGRVLRLAADWFHAVLMEHPAGRAARAYCESRGWTRETLAREMLGYHRSTFQQPSGVYEDAEVAEDDGTGGAGGIEPGSAGHNAGYSKPLSKVLQEAGLMGHPAARAVLAMPGGMLVYAHRRGGQEVYLSGRSIEGKRHWNLPSELVGPRQVYWGSPARAAAGGTVVVEGQADAISLGQMGIGSVGLCGVSGGLGREGKEGNKGNGEGWFVALDGDEAGRGKAADVALGIGPLCRVIWWPEAWGVKDANEALVKGYTAGDVHELMELAPTVLELMSTQAGRVKGPERKAALDRLLPAYRSLLEDDPVAATDLKPALARGLGVGISQLNRLLKAEEKKQEDEKEEASRIEYSSGAAVGTKLFEQCVVFEKDGTARVSFALRMPDGRIEQRGMVDAAGVTYVPYPASMGLITKKVVLFPSGPEQYGDQRTLLRRVREFIHRYLDVDPFYEKLASYYVLFSWVYDLFETLPYLRALGDYGTGKSRFLQTVGAICYRPMFVSGASTTSPIFRIIDMFKGTLIIDEADFSQSDTDAEIMKILNVGYQRGGVVLRAEKDPNSSNDDYWPAAKDVYGPKVLATRKLFTDRATESRCLTKRMPTARPRPDIPYVLGPEFWNEALSLRNQLLMYRLKNYRPMAVERSLADESIEPRLNQVTMALKAMVDDQDVLEDITTFVRAYNETLISDRQLTLPAVVVGVLAEIWFSGVKANLIGEDMRDFTMTGLATKAQEVLNELDPDVRISAKKMSTILTEDLGLSRRSTDSKRHKGRKQLQMDEVELLNLMQRYGIDIPERE